MYTTEAPKMARTPRSAKPNSGSTPNMMMTATQTIRATVVLSVATPLRMARTKPSSNSTPSGAKSNILRLLLLTSPPRILCWNLMFASLDNSWTRTASWTINPTIMQTRTPVDMPYSMPSPITPATKPTRAAITKLTGMPTLGASRYSCVPMLPARCWN